MKTARPLTFNDHTEAITFGERAQVDFASSLQLNKFRNA